MLHHHGITRRIVVSWFLGTAFALLSVATTLADSGGSPFVH